MDELECRYLLAVADIGRVVVTAGAAPAALPVSYRLVGDAIVFRSAPGAKLTAALDGAVVGFEIDRIDPATRSGWSVLVVGMSRVVTDPAEIAELDSVNIPQWLPEASPYYVEIVIRKISGRCLTNTLW
jgi:nitroimidazol reductase NimA-like FMN-containing flavoprotein (pyridoxamine 5'-phosphate oxidase superfamily)